MTLNSLHPRRGKFFLPEVRSPVHSSAGGERQTQRDAEGGLKILCDPFQVVLHFPLTELRARLDLQEVELNPSLDPSLFRVPVGARE